MPLSGEFAADLIAQLREVPAALKANRIPCCIIGGVAVNAWGSVRATYDLDLMLRAEDAAAAHALVTNMGYEVLDPGTEILSYVRADMRLDFLLARRPITRGLLERAQMMDIGGTALAVIPLEGLLGLKIQAFHDNPTRFKDMEDIFALVRLHRNRLNLDEVRGYFRLFDMESSWNAILQSTQNAGADGSATSG